MLRWLRRDDRIDRLIRANAARYLPGMEKPDLEQMRIISRVRWAEAEAAQRRT